MSQNRRVQRGFPNRARIEAALQLLYGAMHQGRLPPLPHTLWAGWRGYDAATAMISVQELVRDVARRYELEIGTIVVAFTEAATPAHVELHDGEDFLVKINPSLRDQPRVLGAALGHEVAHIFLHKHGLRFPETLDNEILTDTTSALYGFGALVLDSFVQTEEHVGLGVHQTTSESYYGYLTPDELGWLLARVTANGSQSAQDWFNRVSDVKGRLESPAARRVWTEGQELALEEATNPPLGTRAFGRWWMYLLSRWWAELREVNQSFRAGLAYAFGGGRVTFQCFRCTQKLRLPVRKKVVATCGNCGDSMEYET